MQKQTESSPAGLSGFSKSGILLFLTVLFSGTLIALAIYNASLWSNGQQPANSLSRAVLTFQLVAVLTLFLTGLIHIITAMIQVCFQKWKVAAIHACGIAAAAVAILFTMIFDQGSIFFQ
ncbi:MAG: hypothetical protein AAF939_12285 [Planctomycetota bacterium]